jgi:hypothetical protein
MKNIHVLPTDKPSRLFINPLWENQLRFLKEKLITKNKERLPQNIYITSDEEIKEGDWRYDIELNRIEKGKETGTFKNWKKIILTTDQDLIKDGVQAIDDEFLEWFVKNPSCEFVDIKYQYWKEINDIGKYTYQIIIPKEEPKQIKCYCGHTTSCDCSPLEEPNIINDWLEKHGDPEVAKQVEKEAKELHEQATLKEKLDKIVSKEPSKFWKESDERFRLKETLEEAVLKSMKSTDDILEEIGVEEGVDYRDFKTDEFERKMAIEWANFGAKWQAERMYSEEELRESFTNGFYTAYGCKPEWLEKSPDFFNIWFKQFKKK